MNSIFQVCLQKELNIKVNEITFHKLIKFRFRFCLLINKGNPATFVLQEICRDKTIIFK